jgi:tetratricopeptide (TPR) repeat protein
VFTIRSKGIFRRILRTAHGAALSVAVLAAVARAEDCTHDPLVELPMVQNDLGTPIVSILIDGRPHNVLLDSGGFWSLVDPVFAKPYGRYKSRIEGQLGLDGVKLNRAVHVPSIQLGPVKIPKVDFFEAPAGYLQVEATLGANWLSRFDVEIDPVGKKVVFFPQNHCEADILHWPHSDLAELPVMIDRRQNLVTIPLELDGKEIRALIDTGSPETFLSLRTAKQLFDFDPDKAEEAAMDASVDQKGRYGRVYRARFHALKMGDIVFQSPWLLIAPMAGNGPDMILGMHDLSSLHLYFAYAANTLYATTAHGDMTASHAIAKPGAAPAIVRPGPLNLTSQRDYLITAATALKKGGYDDALAALDAAVRNDPDDPQAYLQRGELFTLRGQRERAIQDFDRVIALDPKNSAGFLERSELHTIEGDAERALADSNGAMRLEPNAEGPYAARAEAYAAGGAWDRAMQDAGAAIRLNPNSTIGYLTRSHIYELRGDYPRAIEDADTAVALQPKSAFALNARCWTRAILALLDAALNDCDKAVALRPYSVEILDSRAFVHLKSGRLDAAIADYDAALNINPHFASSLYGRGLAKQERGDTSGAALDIAAAKTVDSEIVRHFGR